MHAPTHHLPGRLRLRFRQLKNQAGQLEHLAAGLRATCGVIDVQTSLFTGGALVRYDPVVGKSPAFWDQVEAVLLSQHLYMDTRPPVGPSGDAAAGLVRRMAGGVAAALTDKLIERSAIALLAALL